jgi:hypothetical protein
MFYVYLSNDFTIFITTDNLSDGLLLCFSDCEITADDLALYYFNKYN